MTNKQFDNKLSPVFFNETALLNTNFMGKKNELYDSSGKEFSADHSDRVITYFENESALLWT